MITPDEPLKEELKPCPLCGNENIAVDKISDEFGERTLFMAWCDQKKGGCSDASMQGHDREGAINAWNSAYCWKEIATLQAKIEELEKQLKDQRAVNKYEPGDFRGSEQ